MTNTQKQLLDNLQEAREYYESEKRNSIEFLEAANILECYQDKYKSAYRKFFINENAEEAKMYEQN